MEKFEPIGAGPDDTGGVGDAPSVSHATSAFGAEGNVQSTDVDAFGGLREVCYRC